MTITIDDYFRQSNCREKLVNAHGDKCVVPWCKRKSIDVCCILAPFVWKSIHQTGVSAYNSLNVFQCCGYHRGIFEKGIIMPQSIRKWMGLPHPAGVPFPCDFLGQETDNPPMDDLPDLNNLSLQPLELVVKSLKDNEIELPWDFDSYNKLLEIFPGQEDYRLHLKNFSRIIRPSDFNRILPTGKYLICSAYPFYPRYIMKGFATIIEVKNYGGSNDRGFFLPKRN